MAQIIFAPNLDPGNLPPARSVTLVDSAWLRMQLDNMRAEWTEATPDLSKVTCNLGAIFDELGELIGGE
jgi:hypothetical protein